MWTLTTYALRFLHYRLMLFSDDKVCITSIGWSRVRGPQLQFSESMVGQTSFLLFFT